jgi:hypothetical protein
LQIEQTVALTILAISKNNKKEMSFYMPVGTLITEYDDIKKQYVNDFSSLFMEVEIDKSKADNGANSEADDNGRELFTPCEAIYAHCLIKCDKDIKESTICPNLSAVSVCKNPHITGLLCLEEKAAQRPIPSGTNHPPYMYSLSEEGHQKAIEIISYVINERNRYEERVKKGPNRINTEPAEQKLDRLCFGYEVAKYASTIPRDGKNKRLCCLSNKLKEWIWAIEESDKSAKRDKEPIPARKLMSKTIFSPVQPN